MPTALPQRFYTDPAVFAVLRKGKDAALKGGAKKFEHAFGTAKAVPPLEDTIITSGFQARCA